MCHAPGIRRIVGRVAIFGGGGEGGCVNGFPFFSVGRSLSFCDCESLDQKDTEDFNHVVDGQNAYPT